MSMGISTTPAKNGGLCTRTAHAVKDIYTIVMVMYVPNWINVVVPTNTIQQKYPVAVPLLRRLTTVGRTNGFLHRVNVHVVMAMCSNARTTQRSAWRNATVYKPIKATAQPATKLAKKTLPHLQVPPLPLQMAPLVPPTAVQLTAVVNAPRSQR